MKSAVFAGSFDPITNGHMDIIKRASMLVDKLYVAVCINSQKQAFINPDLRFNLIKEACSGIKNVEVVLSYGLLAELCFKLDVNVVIKGVRNFMDFESEKQQAFFNNLQNEKLETIILFAKENNTNISSTMVRELVKYNKDISQFVPLNVKKFLDKGER